MISKTINPKVSVCIVAYNQASYIEQCLQSVVAQMTDFTFEIIVGDDCSTDGTAEIIKRFVARYPDLVTAVLHEKNIGPYENFLSVHRLAKGDYIAHLDGDDYALPGKLQTQADYLDSNPGCNIVWHRMYVLNDRTGVQTEDLINIAEVPKEGFTRADILRFITIGMNSSKMYRRAVRDFIQPSFLVVDYFANVEQVGTGIACFAGDKPLGVYRANMGIASSGSMTHRALKKSFLFFSQRYPEHMPEINMAVLVLLVAAIKNMNWARALFYLPVAMRTFRFSTVALLFKSRRLLAMLRLPNAVRQ